MMFYTDVEFKIKLLYGILNLPKANPVPVLGRKTSTNTKTRMINQINMQFKVMSIVLFIFIIAYVFEHILIIFYLFKNVA